MKRYPITPMGKPRMTKADAWKKRECVLRYSDFKDECRLRKLTLPESGYHVVCVIPMPKSWSKKEKAEMLHQPHRQRPDKDNLEKAILDAIYGEDSHIWDGRITKIWGDTGEIIVTECPPFELEDFF